MSTTTPNLGLFKYNPETDGKETFSITTALNNNWDLIDNAMNSSSGSGVSGYMRFGNGLIINYGQAAVSSQEVDFVQPVLTADGTLGGNSFAVSATSSIKNAIYSPFDGTTNTSWLSANASPQTYTFYNPQGLKILSIITENTDRGGWGHITDGTVDGSNDNANWTTLKSFSGVGSGKQTVTINSPAFYKYHRIVATKSTYANHMQLVKLTLNATYMTQAINNITFPCAFTTTNYAYSLSYLNGVFGESYATNLTTTGMTLQNNSSADAVYYIAVGY